MSWGTKKQRIENNNRLPPFVPILWSVLNSRAYKELNPSAAKALPYFLGKSKINVKDPGYHTTEFHLSYREAHRLGFAYATFSKVIKNLVRLGFIDPVDKGGLRGQQKSFNIFRLSTRWESFGTGQFKKSSWECFIPKPRH